MTLLKNQNKMGTLREIYEKIMEDFPYFRYGATSDRNWKKKIREELNTHKSLFIRVTDDEDVQLWMLDPNVDETFILKNLQPTNLSSDELHKCDICDHLFTTIGKKIQEVLELRGFEQRGFEQCGFLDRFKEF